MIKVLHGILEIAGQGVYSVKGLREIGVHANMVSYNNHKFEYSTDISLNIARKNKWKYPYYALKILQFFVFSFINYDTFHFHFGMTLLPFHMDLKILKLLNKNIYLEFHGSDIRWVFNRRKIKYMDLPELNKNKQKDILKIMKYADGIILHDDELLPHLPRNINIPIFIVPLRMNLKQFTPVYPKENVKKPIIVHAPSNRKGKGTEFILKALENIKDDYELILVEGKTQQEAFQIYQKADIVIDQISVGTYGVFAIEAMALGKPTITYISDEMLQSLPKELPIVNADTDTIQEKIEFLIRNPKKRQQIGQNSRKYVETYHDYKKNAFLLKGIYQKEFKKLDSTDVFVNKN